MSQILDGKKVAQKLKDRLKIEIESLKSKFNYSHEKLYRDDDVYDIILELSYNQSPTIRNKGSAIFIHCSFNDLRNTNGCIALKKKDFLILLKLIKPKTKIFIN